VLSYAYEYSKRRQQSVEEYCCRMRMSC
jgi:hypothetical protein